MLDISRIDPPGYFVAVAHEPFRFMSIAEQAAEDAKRHGKTKIYGTPFLLDFRHVNLLRFDASDFQKVISARLRDDDGHRNVPCALVASDDTNYGMLRMYSAYMEARGLRDISSVLVTTDFDAALAWIKTVSETWHTEQTSDAASNR